MRKIVAVNFCVDIRRLDGGVERLDAQPHGVQLGFHELDLVRVHRALGLGEIHHRGRIGLQLLGAGETQFGLGLLDFKLQLLPLVGGFLFGHLGLDLLLGRLRGRHLVGQVIIDPWN